MAAKRKSRPSQASSSSSGGRRKMSRPTGKPLKKLARAKTKKAAEPAAAGAPIRLQKFLAAAGIGSRRDCEILIVEGRIEVDGQVVTELGTKIDPETSDVRYDGERVRIEKLQYYILNKPPGVVSTSLDPSGRTRVVDLISSHQRVYNVGRLDKSSEGLILVTNDGTMAQYLTHPRYGIEKVYLVQVKGHPQHEDLQLLKQGVHLAEGVAKVRDVEIKRRQKHSTDLKLILDEGKNREIRRLLAKLGHKVVRLVRIAIGPIQLGTLPQGAHRKLNGDEVDALKKWVDRQLTNPAAKSATPPTPVRPAKPSADGTVDPIQQKLAEGRPIHFEDIEKAKAIRDAERESTKRGPGKASGPARKPVKFNTRTVGGIGYKKRSSGPSGGSGTTGTGRPSKGRPTSGRPTKGGSSGSRTGGSSSSRSTKGSGGRTGAGRPGGGRTGGGRSTGGGRPSSGGRTGGRPGRPSKGGGRNNRGR